MIASAYAPNIYATTGKIAMEKTFKAMEAVVMAATASMEKPMNGTSKKNNNSALTNESDGIVSRVHHMYIMTSEVNDAPTRGGFLGKGNIRRKQKLMYMVSSSKPDMISILNDVHQETETPEEYEKIRFFGNGEEGMKQLDEFIADQKKKRKRPKRKKATLDSFSKTV